VSVAPAARSSFSIQALTLNYGSVSSSSKEKAVRWIKPPARQYKLNVDAAYYSTGLGAVAAIIRNDHGEAIAGGAIPMTNIMDAATAEASAMQFGLQMVENMGCSPVTAESDCLELVNACTGVIELWSPYTAILADCFQIASRIGQIKFQHSRREANKAAHNLAKLCFETDSSLSWDGDPPPSVLVDVLNDLSNLDQ
jgi:ribonuclease HI